MTGGMPALEGSMTTTMHEELILDLCLHMDNSFSEITTMRDSNVKKPQTLSCKGAPEEEVL